MVDNNGIIAKIDDLITEEDQLRARAVGTGLTETEQERVRLLERQLDQCWDLLRRRRAQAEFGNDPNDARPRPADEVESYQQ